MIVICPTCKAPHCERTESEAAKLYAKLNATAPATTSAIEAAKEIVNVFIRVPRYVVDREATLVELEQRVAAIITKHLNDSARPAQTSAPETPDPETEAVARGIRLDLCHCLDAHKAPNGFAVEAVTCVTHQAITAALTSTRSELLKQIREAVEAEQVEDDGSGVWDAGHYDGINDALAAIDKVAKTSQTEPTNPSET